MTTDVETVFPRVIGRLRGEAPGPSLIVVGGIHGNEPGGLYAARRVLARLGEMGTPLRGEIVVLAGNVSALARRQRFLRADLNRQWTPERVAALGHRGGGAAHGGGDAAHGGDDGLEGAELRGLHEALEEALASARGDVYFLDLHTTSAEGVPFALVGDTLRHRAFAAHFPLTVILGLEEQIDGVLVEHLTARGCVTLVVEAGQHESAAAIDNHEAMLWLALEAAGLAARADVPDFDAAWARLDRARGGLPRVVEALSRHAVAPEDEFRMEPGFANVDRVHAGQLLAHDRTGEIRARADGLILLPLYQALGEDGFFLGRELPPWHMQLSATVRRLHLDALLPLLPGVRRPAAGDEHLEVDGRVAHLYPREIFHLFGYRKIRHDGEGLRVTRRSGAPTNR